VALLCVKRSRAAGGPGRIPPLGRSRTATLTPAYLYVEEKGTPLQFAQQYRESNEEFAHRGDLDKALGALYFEALRGKAMMRQMVVLGVVGAILGYGSTSRAEPYMAVREGLPCAACHTNITGGGKRTDLVATHANEILHVPDWDFMSTFNRPTDAFTGEINQYVALGADLRVSYQAVFQDEPNADGEVDNDKIFRGNLLNNDVLVNEAVGYFEARLIPDVLSIYVDQQVAPNTNNREAWGMIKLPWWGSFMKAGRMFLPYGLQLEDDTAFIREGYNGSANTGFGFDQSQAAFEVGVQPDPVSAIVAVSNGTSSDNDVQVTGTLSAMFTDVPVVRNVYVGGSFSTVNPPGSSTTLFGFFAGFNLYQLTVLGEIDFGNYRNSQTNGANVGTFISYVEADYLFFDWLNLKTAFNYADYDGSLAIHTDDSENRFEIGLEPFINRFFQPRLFYYIGNGVRSLPSHNQNVLMAQLHFFF